MRKILILAANPKNTNQLRLDEEVREIHEGLRRSRSRDQFEIVSRWAVRPEDLRRALLDHEPQIVHFSGHGEGSDGLALENNSGQKQLVSSAAIAQLFKLFQNTVECVLLNACYSEVQAEAIHEHIDYVIGMNANISDRIAIEFAVGFYDGLGANRSYEDAFELGLSAIALEEIDETSIPILKTPGSASSGITKLPSTLPSSKSYIQESSINIPLIQSEQTQKIKEKFEHLSSRDRLILQLLLDHKSDEEISREINIKSSTFRKLISQIYDHFGIKKNVNGESIDRRKALSELCNEFQFFFLNKYHKRTNSNPVNLNDSLISINKSNFSQNIEIKDRNSIRAVKRIRLPHQQNNFVGRDQELKQLIEFISLEYRAPIISVSGIGGVGKTALVLEAAYRCLEASLCNSEDINIERFESIIFTSAKHNILLPEGIVSCPVKYDTKQQIFSAIAHTLDDKSILVLDGIEQVGQVYKALSRQKTLLIVDNMETIADKDEILSFLSNLPSSTKAVITTRERVVLYASLQLNSMCREDAVTLINQQCLEKGVKITNDQISLILNRLGTIPVAIIYMIGQMAIGYNIEHILNRSSIPENIVRFCFDHILSTIQGKPEYNLLISLSIFERGPTIDAISYISGLDNDLVSLQDSLSKLQILSLINFDNPRYRMLPLTREFSLAELAKNQNFHMEIRERWIKWFKKFANDNGNRDWFEYQVRFSKLEKELSNIISVLEWCSTHERYDDVANLWSSLNHFSSLYGYWSMRLKWLQWLAEESLRLGKKSEAYFAMVSESYTLIQLRKIDKAEFLLKECLKLHYCASKHIQTELAQNIALLRFYQKKFRKALLWINKSNELNDKSLLNDINLERKKIDLLSLKADIYCKISNPSDALEIYFDVLRRSNTISWQRRLNSTRRKIADIYIKQQEHIIEAKKLLETGYSEVSRNNDKKNLAKFQRSLAYLENVLGNSENAHAWLVKAINSFQSLNMFYEAEKCNLNNSNSSN